MSPFGIRPFQQADALTLRAVFMSSVHGLACRDYTPAQCAAWAPELEAEQLARWCALMAQRRPYVVELDGRIVAYADVQDDGLIDHFFVAAAYGGQGIGSALLAFLLAQARQRGLDRVYADVSLRAESLFARHGFVVMARQCVVRQGQSLANARMVHTHTLARTGDALPQ